MAIEILLLLSTLFPKVPITPTSQMSSTLDWDPLCACLRVKKNKADYRDIYPLFDQLSADPRSDSVKALIFDFSEFESLELTPLDLQKIAAIVAVPLLNYMRLCRRIAFVCSTPQVESVVRNYIESYSKTKVEKRIFPDEESARIWLSKESKT